MPVLSLVDSRWGEIKIESHPSNHNYLSSSNKNDRLERPIRGAMERMTMPPGSLEGRGTAGRMGLRRYCKWVPWNETGELGLIIRNDVDVDDVVQGSKHKLIQNT